MTGSAWLTSTCPPRAGDAMTPTATELPTRGGVPGDVYPRMCLACGSLVGDPRIHLSWHQTNDRLLREQLDTVALLVERVTITKEADG